MVLSFISKYFDVLMITFIIANLYMRKYPEGKKKRFAFILWAMDLLLVYALLLVVMQFQLPAFTEWVAVGIGVLLILIFHKHFWPFKSKCAKCGKKLSWGEIFSRDEAICDDCYYEEHPEEKKAKEEKEKEAVLKSGNATEEEMDKLSKEANKIDEIPWGSWEPTERCVLTYVMDGDKLLMILKKRGLGEGYWNAPGGHIELEETSAEAAIRETKEETGLDISDVKEMGTLRFQFKDGLRMLGYVFTTTSYSGELIEECEETKPFWLKREEIDYSKMWADDPEWLPLLLEGKHFEGYFLFDDRTLLDSKVETVEEDDEE